MKTTGSTLSVIINLLSCIFIISLTSVSDVEAGATLQDAGSTEVADTKAVSSSAGERQIFCTFDDNRNKMRRRRKRYLYVTRSNGQILTWDTDRVTWAITQHSSQVDHGKQRRIIRQALEKWSSVTPLVFEEVNAESQVPDVEIKFARRRHGPKYDPVFDGRAQPGRPNTLGHAWGPGSDRTSQNGDVHFDEDDDWTDDLKFMSVAVHELGHSLGLMHSQVPDAIMFPAYRESADLSQDDIDGAQALYGSGRGKIRPTQPATRRPVTRRPDTRRPVTRRPDTRRPVTRRPDTRRPVTRKPYTRRPVTWRPVTKRPYTRRPVTRNPYTRRPYTKRPPVTRRPATRRPRTQGPDWRIRPSIAPRRTQRPDSRWRTRPTKSPRRTQWPDLRIRPTISSRRTPRPDLRIKPTNSRRFTLRPNGRVRPTLRPYGGRNGTPRPPRPVTTRRPEVNRRTRRPYVTAAPTTPRPPSTLSPDSFCLQKRVNAIVEDPFSDIRGFYYVIMEDTVHHIMHEGTRTTSFSYDFLFPGAPKQPDVVFTLQEQKSIFIIKDKMMWQYRREGLVEGMPKSLHHMDFPEKPSYAIALSDIEGNRRLYLFGKYYWWNVDVNLLRKSTHYNIHQFSRGFPTDVVFATQWSDDLLYVVTPDRYVVIDLTRRSKIHDEPYKGKPEWFVKFCHSSSPRLAATTSALVLSIVLAIRHLLY